jgi:integrase
MKGYWLKTVKFSNGERYPLLVNQQGIPLWYPTLYITTQVRNAAKAPNTLIAELRAVKLLLNWEEQNGLDIEKSFAGSRFLKDSEIESLARYTQTKKEGGEEKNKVAPFAKKKEGVRVNTWNQANNVRRETQYVRLTYIANYIQWLARQLVERETRWVSKKVAVEIHEMGKNLRARRPLKRGRTRESERKGLDSEQRKSLLDIVEIGSPNNPFGKEIQLRNRLIVHLLFYLGMRHGELLSLRIGKDLDLEGNTLLIARRHDDPSDPRNTQPVNKTQDRRIPLQEDMVAKITEYIVDSRRRVPGAKGHDFLIVSHQKGSYQGAPLSVSGLTDIFSQLRQADPDKLGKLTPHVLRHDWNERFSEWAEEQGLKSPKEEKMRSYIMGWREGSGTAATYTRRHTHKKAKKAVLALQEELKSGGNIDDN